MGGYGALVLALKHPDVYSVTYALTPSPVDLAAPQEGPYTSPQAFAATLQLLSAGLVPTSGIAANIVGLAAAITPNLDNPPTYIDLPYQLIDGQPKRIDALWEQWINHDPMGMLDRYGINLLLYRGVGFDVGLRDNDRDNLTGARALDRALTLAHIPHQYEEYDGDHISKIPERMGTVVLPFVSAHLNPPRRAPDAPRTRRGSNACTNTASTTRSAVRRI